MELILIYTHNQPEPDRYEKYLDRIKTPTLVIQGDRDYVVPQVVGEELAKHLPNAELQLLEDCGHSPFIDCLDVFIKHVEDWLEQK